MDNKIYSSVFLSKNYLTSAADIFLSQHKNINKRDFNFFLIFFMSLYEIILYDIIIWCVEM